MVRECSGLNLERECPTEMLEHVDLCLLIGIHESVGSAAPPSRRNGARDLFEAVRRIELVEREATHQPTGGSVYRNHLAVAEVVPVVEGQQIAAIGHQRVRRADRVLKLDIRNKRVGTIRLTSVKLATCIRTFGRSSETNRIASAPAWNNPYEVLTVLAEDILYRGRGPVICENTKRARQKDDGHSHDKLHTQYLPMSRKWGG